MGDRAPQARRARRPRDERGDGPRQAAPASRRARSPRRSSRALAGSDVVAAAEVAGPGFVNLRLHPRAFHAELARHPARGPRLGPRAGRAPASASTSSSSAPTPPAPCTVASGRNAILGDAVGAPARGARATASRASTTSTTAATRCAPSPRACAPRAEGREPPEDGYKGAYVAELARWLAKVEPASSSQGDVDALGARVRHVDAPRHPGLAHAARHPPTLADLARPLRRLVQRGVAPPLGRGRRRHAPARGGRAPRRARTARSSSRRPRARSTTRTASSRRATAPGRTSRRTSRTSPTRSHAATTA